MSHDPAETTISDEELACRAQGGCAESFEKLLRRFQTPVLQFLRHRGCAADAEDLTQETFVRVYENLHRYDRRKAFSTWLFTIARRTGINHRRRARPIVDGSAAAVQSSAPAPLETLAAAETRGRLWGLAAETLSEEQTTALWLHYVEDMPLKDVALVLGCSRAAVKVLMFRARRRLLPLLDEQGEPRPAAVAVEVLSHD